MANARSNRRRSSSSGSRRPSGSSRKSARSSSPNRRPLQDRDTGYRIGSNRKQRTAQNINPRLIVAGIIGVLLIIGLVFGVSSCVRGCSSSRAEKKQEAANKEEKVNPDDKRVAYGVSTEVTSKLSAVLDRNESFETIAKNADKIDDERLIDLAIAEPEAISFVAGAVKSDGSTQPFGATLPQGDYPLLYTFDTRWGYAPYADGMVGSAGSGPVALSMASMGLSGKTTYDPTTIAQAVHAANLDNGTTGMDDAFLTNHATEAGVNAQVMDVASEIIYDPLSSSQPVLIKLKPDSGVGSASAHWALITKINDDNSISVHDPTSVAASTHSWSLGAICSRCDAAYALTAAAVTTSTTSGDTDDNTTVIGSETGEQPAEETGEEG